MRIKVLLFLLSVIFLLCTSCKSSDGAVKAKGPIVEKTFEFGKDYDRIEVKHGWKVKLMRSPRLRAIARTQESIVDYVYPRVINGRLIIDFSPGVDIYNISTQEITVYYKDLREIKVSSDAVIVSDVDMEQARLDLIATSRGTLTLNKLKIGETNVNASDDATVELKGTSLELNGELSKKARLKGRSFTTKTATLKALTGSKIFIDVIEKITADADSGALIQYSGNPVYKDGRNQ